MGLHRKRTAGRYPSLTIEQVRRALRTAAYVVARYSNSELESAAIAIFERVEKELKDRLDQEAAKSRALYLVDTSSRSDEELFGKQTGKHFEKLVKF